MTEWKNLDQKTVRVLMITRTVTIVAVTTSVIWAIVKMNTNG